LCCTKQCKEVLPTSLGFFSFFFIFALTYLLFRVKAFGGADAKALIVLSILVPAYPALELGGQNFPLLGVPLHGLFSLTVFENALLLTTIVPLGIFCYNLFHFSPVMLKNPFYMLVAYRVNIGGLRLLLEKGRRIRLIEHFEFDNEKLVPHFTGNGIVLNLNAISRLEAHASKGLMESFIWVTPGLPFMVPISAGFLTAVVLGDLIFYLIIKFIEYWNLLF